MICAIFVINNCYKSIFSVHMYAYDKSRIAYIFLHLSSLQFATFCYILLHVATFQIILNSMHKYQPRVRLVQKHDVSSGMTSHDAEEYKTFVFTETVFIAVTAYQNQLVCALLFCQINL